MAALIGSKMVNYAKSHKMILISAGLIIIIFIILGIILLSVGSKKKKDASTVSEGEKIYKAGIFFMVTGCILMPITGITFAVLAVKS